MGCGRRRIAIRVVDHASLSLHVRSVLELLVVVLLLFILCKVSTVEVKQTMGELVARESPEQKSGPVLGLALNFGTQVKARLNTSN